MSQKTQSTLLLPHTSRKSTYQASNPLSPPTSPPPYCCSQPVLHRLGHHIPLSNHHPPNPPIPLPAGLIPIRPPSLHTSIFLPTPAFCPNQSCSTQACTPPLTPPMHHGPHPTTSPQVFTLASLEPSSYSCFLQPIRPPLLHLPGPCHSLYLCLSSSSGLILEGLYPCLHSHLQPIRPQLLHSHWHLISTPSMPVFPSHLSCSQSGHGSSTHPHPSPQEVLYWLASILPHTCFPLPAVIPLPPHQLPASIQSGLNSSTQPSLLLRSYTSRSIPFPLLLLSASSQSGLHSNHLLFPLPLLLPRMSYSGRSTPLPHTCFPHPGNQAWTPPLTHVPYVLCPRSHLFSSGDLI